MASERYATLDEFVAALPSLAAPIEEKLKGQSGLFALRTRQGRVVNIRLGDGRVTLPETLERDPDCSLEADEKDLLALVNRELSPAKALLFGKIRVRGNKALLLKLAALV